MIFATRRREILQSDDFSALVEWVDFARKLLKSRETIFPLRPKTRLHRRVDLPRGNGLVAQR